MTNWQRADLEAMAQALCRAAENDGLRWEHLTGLGAATKHRLYIKHLCATGLLCLAQKRNQRRREEDVYIPLPSASYIIHEVWKSESEYDENRQRDMLGAACWSILYREPMWRAFTDIQVALFLGLLYHEHGRSDGITNEIEAHANLAAVCLQFFAYAKDLQKPSALDRLDACAYDLRKRAEGLLGLRDFYGIFRQTAESMGLRFGDLSLSWPRWLCYWLKSNQIPVLLSGHQLPSTDDRRLLDAFLSLDMDRDAVVSAETMSWDLPDMQEQKLRWWLLGLPIAEHAGELRPLRAFEWLTCDPEHPDESWPLPDGSIWLSNATAHEWQQEYCVRGSRVVANALPEPQMRDFDQEMVIRLREENYPKVDLVAALLPSEQHGPCYGQGIPAEEFVSDLPTKVSRYHPYLFVINLIVDYIRNEENRSTVQIVMENGDYRLAADDFAAELGPLVRRLLENWGFRTLPIRSYQPLWQEATDRGLLPPSIWQEAYAPRVARDTEWRKTISRPFRKQVVDQIIAIAKQGEEKPL